MIMMRSMIYTTNWIERLNRDFRRTTRMRGAQQKVDAALLLLGGVAMDISCYQRKVPKLDYEKEKFNWEEYNKSNGNNFKTKIKLKIKRNQNI